MRGHREIASRWFSELRQFLFLNLLPADYLSFRFLLMLDSGCVRSVGELFCLFFLLAELLQRRVFFFVVFL
jgi:hypothetical protein